MRRRGTFRDGPQAVTQPPQFNRDLALVAPLRNGPTVDRMGFSPNYDAVGSDLASDPFQHGAAVDHKQRQRNRAAARRLKRRKQRHADQG